jgi:hypothetical protein
MVAVVEETIEHRADRGCVAKQLAPVFEGPSRIASYRWRRQATSDSYGLRQLGRLCRLPTTTFLESESPTEGW